MTTIPEDYPEVPPKPDMIAKPTCGLNPDWLSAFKRIVPSNCRWFDWNSKVWFVTEEHSEEVDTLTKRYFTRKAGIDWQQAWGVLHLKPTAPLYLIDVIANSLIENCTDERQQEVIEAARWLLLNL